MEKGEIAVLTIQFGALALVVLFLGNFVPTGAVQSATAINGVYWGSPDSGVKIGNAATLTTTVNQTNIYASFGIEPSAGLASISAGRFCTDPTHTQGESRTYTTEEITFSRAQGTSYLTFSPTGQKAGWSCLYSVQITDSIGQVAKWQGTVVLSAGAGS